MKILHMSGNIEKHNSKLSRQRTNSSPALSNTLFILFLHDHIYFVVFIQFLFSPNPIKWQNKFIFW